MGPTIERLIAVVVAAVAVAFGLVAVTRHTTATGPSPAPSAAPLAIRYSGEDRTVAGEHDERDADLELTSGELDVRDGHAFTDSAVFRARTRRADFADAAVTLRIRNDGLFTTRRTGTRTFDGISLGVRYGSPFELYYINVARRDGTVAIKKKLPSGSGGRYTTLASTARPAVYGRWEDVEVDVRTEGDAVAISLVIDGARVLEARDTHGKTILHPGRVLLRSDNCRFSFNNVVVRRVASVTP